MSEQPHVPAVIVEATDAEVFVLPHSGEVVSLAEEVSCGVALDEVRRMQAHLSEAVRVLSGAIAARAAVLGTKTVNLSGGRKAEVRGGPETAYDAQELERLLRLAGMPEERINEIVTTEVTYKVKAVEAKRAAGANPEYARAIEAASTTVERPYSVTIRRR